MQPDSIDQATARQQLGRVLASAGFAKNERLSLFLRFIVERHLEGRETELKESVIGVEVFGRKPGFDPKVDAIVRTEAVRLRARLAKYYEAEGAADTLIIEVPKGGYRPTIRERQTSGAPSTRSAWRWRLPAAVSAGLLVVAAGTGLSWWPPGPGLDSGHRRYEENVEPYTLYVRGRQMMASFPSQNRSIVDVALGHYEEALAMDATFAPAYAGMADAYLAVERNIGVAPSLGPDLLGQARTAARRALELDPLLSEAHSSTGSIHAREYAWEDAERSFRRAIELNHNNAMAHLELGFHVLLMQGRVDEGLDEVRRAVRLDPRSPYVNTELGRALFWARRYDAAIDQLRVAVALDPSRARPYGVLARALSAQGRTGEAMAVFEDAVRRGAVLAHLANGDLACVMARAGRLDAVAAMLQRQLASPVANIAARLHTCLGDGPRALEYLEQALEANQPNLAEIVEDPDSDWLRAEPRLVTLRQKLNLP